MKIDRQTIEKLSKLIQIKLSEEEKDLISGQLEKVMDSVNVLNELDVTNVEITSQTHGLKNILRDDIVGESLDIEKYQNNTNLYQRYFRVKKVL